MTVLPALFKNKNQVLLLLLPLLYVCFCLAFLHGGSGFYMTGHDPVYPYLMNALNLASGHMELGIVEHPGTPVEYLGAIILNVKHFFNGHGLSLTEDVLQHAESYLYTCSYVLIFSLFLISFFTARFVFRRTGNIYVSVFLLLGPLIAPDILQHAILFKPEALIVLLTFFFSAFLYVRVSENPDDVWDTKTLLFCGLFWGMLIATKIICAPFILTTLFILPGIRKRVLFLFSTLVSFLLGVIPLITKYHIVLLWFKDLINHDGKYGSGKEHFIDPALFSSHLGEIFGTYPVFTICFIIITLGVLITMFRVILKKVAFSVPISFLTGLWVATLILVFFVAKHFSFHYLICAEIFFPAGVLVSCELLAPLIHLEVFIRYKQILSRVLMVTIAALLCIPVYTSIAPRNDFFKAMNDTHKFISSFGHTPAITISNEHSAFIEPSIWFGIIYTGDLRPEYFGMIKKHFPDTYFYLVESGKLILWDEDVFILDLFRKYPKMLVYFIDQSPEEEKKVMDSFCNASGPVAAYRKIYSKGETNETIYQIDVDSSKIPKVIPPRIRIASDLETMTPDKAEFLSADGNYHLRSGELATKTEHHSGKCSVLMDEQHQFGLDVEFDVKPGDKIVASVWRKAEDKSGIVVIASIEPNHLYTASYAVVNTDPNGWEQIQCKVQVPNDYPEKKAKFYMYYVSNKPAYFDDVLVTVTPEK